MGKGKSSSAPQYTESKVTQTALPEYAEPYVTRQFARGERESLMPYMPYGGQRIAEFSPQEEVGLSAVEGQFAQGTPWEQQMGAARTAGIAGTPTLPGFTQPGVMQQYMSPYMQNVVDVQQREARRQADISRKALEDQAAAAGAFGGYGYGTAVGEMERGLQEQLQGIQARGLQDAYTAGLGQLGAERAAQETAMQRQLAASQQLGAFGEARERGQMGRTQALIDAGKQRRGLRQESLSMGYQDYLNQLAYPRQQLGFYGQLLRGLPTQPGTQVSSYQPQPSTMQQMLGLGLGGLGLYGQLRGQGAG